MSHPPKSFRAISPRSMSAQSRWLAAAFCLFGATMTYAADDPPNSPPSSDPVQVFEPRDFSDADGNVLKFRLLKPLNYDPDRKYPLVLFLHGAGERGDDNTAQLKHGMKDFADPARRAEYPCYVVAPQCPTGSKWVDVDWSSASSEIPEKPSTSLRLAFEVVKHFRDNAAVDANRIYVTGLSMGGYGTWDAIARHPDWFAAAAPICGGGDTNTAEKIKDMPIWCFHGDADSAVPVGRSRKMIEAIKEAGGSPRYTEYPGVGHDSWSQTYSNPDFYKWMFSKRLSTTP